MDYNLIILALETLREQVQDSYSYSKEEEDKERIHRINEQLDTLKSELNFDIAHNITRIRLSINKIKTI